MIRVLTTVRRAPIEHVVFRACCTHCGRKWPEAAGEFEARRMSQGHDCKEEA